MAAIVVDTNVWLDWLVFADPGVDWLKQAVRSGRFELLSCPRARDELIDVLARPLIARRIADLEATVREHDALIVLAATPEPCDLACSDPDDQVFLDLAVARRARGLLTKDRALLALSAQARRRHGLLIAPPSAPAWQGSL
jgi:putative PIN family toxin of toxin-antitoxin system